MRKMMILSAFVAAAAIAAPSYAQTAPPAPESGAEQAPDQTMPSEAEPDTQEAPDQATPPETEPDTAPAPQPGPQSGMSTNGDSAPIQMLPKSPVVQSTADTQAPAEYPRCTASKKDECRNPGGV